MRYGPGMQTGTLTFFELLKQPEFLHSFLLVPWVTSASSTHPSPILLLSFSSQHYARANFLPEENFLPCTIWSFPYSVSPYPHIPALFPYDVFMRQHYYSNINFSVMSRTIRAPRHHCCWKEGPRDDPCRVAATSCNQQGSIWDGFFSSEVLRHRLSAEELIPPPNLFRFSIIPDMTCLKTFSGGVNDRI